MMFDSDLYLSSASSTQSCDTHFPAFLTLYSTRIFLYDMFHQVNGLATIKLLMVTKLSLSDIMVYSTRIVSCKCSAVNAYCLGLSVFVAPQAPPENVTAVAVNGSSIRVSWGSVPKDKRNGIITGYRVLFGSRTLKNVTNGTRQVRGTQNSVVIGDLEMFVTYSFRVQARTKIGRGNFSEPVNQTTTQTGRKTIVVALYR